MSTTTREAPVRATRFRRWIRCPRAPPPGSDAAAIAAGLLRDGLTRSNSIAYVCDIPDTILAAGELLAGRGFPEKQTRKQLCWPKGKEPKAATE